MIEASCNLGTLRYPDHEFQIDFQKNICIEPYSEIRRFYKDYIKEDGAP